MAIDFTGVTNVFMGGGSCYNADTSLQAVYQGETEQWSYTDQGYVWRMMGSTLDGYDRFTVGDIVCIGHWNSRDGDTTKTYTCTLSHNYLTIRNTQYVVKVTRFTDVASWSDAIGSDGVKIGWHLPDKTDTLNMENYSYVVKQTANNGVYARLSQGYGTLGTYTSNVYCGFYPLSNIANQWWCTYNTHGNNQERWWNGYIHNSDNTKIYLEGSTEFLKHTTATNNNIEVVFKRVRIAQ